MHRTAAHGGRGNTWRSRAIAMAALAFSVGAAMVAPSMASANTYLVMNCHDPWPPSGVVLVGDGGWSTGGTGDLGLGATDACDAGNAGSLMSVSDDTTGLPQAQQVAYRYWQFAAPSGTGITAYALYDFASNTLAWNGQQGVGWGDVQVYDSTGSGYAFRNSGQGSVSPGSVARTIGQANPATWLRVQAGCDWDNNQAPWWCPANSFLASAEWNTGWVELVTDNRVTVSDVAGSLLAGGNLSGAKQVSFDASDGAPGVRDAWLVVDGTAQSPTLLDSIGGECGGTGYGDAGGRWWNPNG